MSTNLRLTREINLIYIPLSPCSPFIPRSPFWPFWPLEPFDPSDPRGPGCFVRIIWVKLSFNLRNCAWLVFNFNIPSSPDNIRFVSEYFNS